MQYGAPTKSAEEVTFVSDNVADSPHKIFVAGISGAISSEMLMEIVSAFGPLAAYRFLFNEELGGSCAFLEYIDPSITPKACAGLNGMKLGGRVLTAVHVITPPAEVDNEATPFYGIPDNAKSLLEEPTKVLQLKNVFDQEEYMLLSKSELDEALEDVRIECARFGAVKSVNVVEHISGSDDTAKGKVLQPADQSTKIEPTELLDHDNSIETASECSVPIQCIDVPDDSDYAKKDVDCIPEGLGQKDLPSDAALCEGHSPGTGLDGIQERAVLPTFQQVEADHKAPEASADEDKCMEAAEASAGVDDDAVEKGLVGSAESETCRSSTLGDEAEKAGRENKQPGADGASEDHSVKAPAVETGAGADAFVFEPYSILVEFTREEAACMAAHSLHGRRFGSRTVSVRYAPHDLYLQKYPKK